MECLAGEIEPACVKGPGQQCAAVSKDQPAGAAGRVAGDCGHIVDMRDLFEQPPLEGPVERAEVDPTRLLPPTLNAVEEVTTIRQKSWKAMRNLLSWLVKRRQLCDFSARRRNPQQPTRHLPRENHAGVAPDAPCRSLHLPHRSYPPPSDLHLFHLAPAPESH